MYADTKDPFVNAIYKKLRNKKKKLDKIKEAEDKLKKEGLKMNPDQLEMINSKEGILEEMKENQAIIKMYQEAFPENPIWQTTGKKDKKQKKPQQQSEQVPAQIQ